MRALTSDESSALACWTASRTAPARTVERARLLHLAARGTPMATIRRQLGVTDDTIRARIRRFNAEGLAALDDRPRSGRPPVYSAAAVGTAIERSLTDPRALDQPFASWTLERLRVFLAEHDGLVMSTSQLCRRLRAEGLRWRTQETWFGERVDPAFAEKRGPSSRSAPTRLAAV